MPDTQGILGHHPALVGRLLQSFIRLIRWLMGLTILFQIASTKSFDVSRVGGMALVLVATFQIQRLLEKERLILAINSLLIVIYLAMLPGLFHCGLMVATTLALPGTAPLAALLLGLPYGIAYAVLNLGTMIAFLYAQQHGWHPSGAPSSLPMWAAAEIVIALTVMIYQAIPANGLFSALHESDEKQHELDQVVRHLEEETTKLSALVEEHTQGLRDANESLTRLSASLSHDLRAPLRSITGFAKILADEKVPDSVKAQLNGILSDVASLQLILEKTMINLRRENNA